MFFSLALSRFIYEMRGKIMTRVIVTSILLGIGLAMDACAVSMADGLKDSKMNYKKTLLIALMFGLFQGLMPFLGYIVGCQFLTKIEWLIPWVALILLGYIGADMLIGGIKNKDEDEEIEDLTLKVLFVQAIATSIDALSVGFSIANYTLLEAVVCVSFIAFITFAICVAAVFIGKKFGTKLGNKAEILGGIILIAIGIEIFITGMFF